MRRSPLLLPLLLIAAFGWTLPAAAQLIPLGAEVRVDDDGSLPDPVECPQVSVAPNGGFVVAWTPAQEEGGGSCLPDGAIYGRFFNPQGVSRSPRPSRIATSEGNCIDDLRLGPFIDGSAVALWRESFGDLDPFTSIAGASFSALGEFDPLPLLPQKGIPVGTLTSGGFVFLFDRGSLGGFDAEAYDRHGTLLMKRFAVSRIAGTRGGYAVAELEDGGFIFSWISDRRSNGHPVVLARRFDRKGQPGGREIQISDSSSIPSPTRPTLAAGSGTGSYVIAWTGGPTLGDALYRVFNRNGSARTPALRGNTNSGGEQNAGSLTAAANGDFVLTWQRLHRPLLSFELVGRLLAPDGTLRGDALPLPTPKQGFQFCGSVRTNGTGLWVAAWLGDGPQGRGVYVRRFTGSSVPPSIGPFEN